MKINPIISQNCTINKANSKNKQAFGMNLEIAPEVLKQVAGPRSKFMLDLLCQKAMSEHSARTLSIRQVNNAIEGTLKSETGSVLLPNIKPQIGNLKGSNPAAKAIETIYTTATNFLQKQRQLVDKHILPSTTRK